MVLDDEAGVATQIAIWGWFMIGDMLETVALVTEGKGELVTGGAWDRTAADLAMEWIAHDLAPYRRVKDWSALPWVGEHMIRGHEEWAGL